MPLPAGVWLMLAGLMALGRARRPPGMSSALATTTGPAQTTQPGPGPERCYLPGRIALSHLLGTLGSADPAVIDPALARVHRSAGLYRTLSCDMPALAGAMDCVLVSDTGSPPQTRARQRLRDTGLARAE